jgi:flagella basal body P-ring formation protein FlgA
MRMKPIAFLLPLLAIASPAAAVTPFQNLDALEARLINALGAGIGEPGGPASPIDRRMKLATCTQSVTIDPPVLGAVALRCPSVGWRIRVPIQRLQNSGGSPTTIGTNPAPMPAKIDPVVRRGDPVDLVADTSGFSVSVSATAQEDGVPGARIRVKTQQDGKPQGQIIFAEVVDVGRVKLPGFN